MSWYETSSSACHHKMLQDNVAMELDADSVDWFRENKHWQSTTKRSEFKCILIASQEMWCMCGCAIPVLRPTSVAPLSSVATAQMAIVAVSQKRSGKSPLCQCTVRINIGTNSRWTIFLSRLSKKCRSKVCGGRNTNILTNTKQYPWDWTDIKFKEFCTTQEFEFN